DLSGAFLAVGNGGVVYSSPDGKLWTLESGAHGTSAVWGVASGINQVHAVGDSGKLTQLEQAAGLNDQYTSEADLLNDALKPPSGSYNVYLAGGYFRLGSPPMGLITCDAIQGGSPAQRTGGQFFSEGLDQSGNENLPNKVETDDLEDNTYWGRGGTPVFTDGVTDPYGGTDAFTLEDNSVGSKEYIQHVFSAGAGDPFSTDGDKTVEIWVEENTTPALGHVIALYDTIAAAYRMFATITAWVAGEPTVAMTTGTEAYRYNEPGTGWWKLTFSCPDVVAANSNQLLLYPAWSAAQVGKLNIYRVMVYDGPTARQSFSTDDVAALDTANDSPLGYWTGIGDMTGSELNDIWAASVGAWWGVDRDGVFRMRVLTDPTTETAALTITQHDMIRRGESSSLEKLPLREEGLPSYKTIVRYSRNFTPQHGGELALGVTASKRAEYGGLWKEYVKTDATVQTAHLLATEMVYDTAFTLLADATTEGDRLQALRGVKRDRFQFVVPLDDEFLALDLGSYVEIEHPRFGLSAGKTFIVIGVEPDAERKEITLEVWG
ncbi:MAG TPA: hypothetical protein VM118_05625, partial [Acidobacteriota bacterium]|nr:hypothetical protein [Acidobacteriota bacterium]